MQFNRNQPDLSIDCATFFNAPKAKGPAGANRRAL
jgi:hypothetical protein